MAGFRPNSEIIGKFRKLKKLYGHFVKRQKYSLQRKYSLFQRSMPRLVVLRSCNFHGKNISDSRDDDFQFGDIWVGEIQ